VGERIPLVDYPLNLWHIPEGKEKKIWEMFNREPFSTAKNDGEQIRFFDRLGKKSTVCPMNRAVLW
jgi:hypothetical protein